MIQTLADALSERGYETLTPVQDAVSKPELAWSDLLVSAQTGSGKTVGFGLAIAPTLLDGAERFGPPASPLGLVIAPTRELAFQVMRELTWLYAKAGARIVSCVGGMDMRDERRALERGAHIVVGTPGRLVDHIQRGSLDMTGLRAVVLDEADEMLDLGFREDLEFMLGEAPEERRTLLFSATVPPMIAKLAQQYQRNAERITTISDREQHADITYLAVRVAQHDVENAVINLLRFHEAENAIVFANTRAAVARLAARFANRGFSVVSLSGELSQTERSHALQAMRDGRARVCVATDVAARGIDLPKLELVVHAELPSNAETLLHRSGRTGRAGRKGVSALVVPPKVAKKAERLLKFAKLTAEWTEAPGAEEILRRDEERLMADPAWSEAPSEAEAEFAARLVAERTPEQIAAAYLRLYRAQHSAPEDLSPPDARPPARERGAAKDREPFGPSRWFSLSVGRNDRAEARWLLPLILRTSRIEKNAIGAIRVQNDETFVEIAEDSAESFAAVVSAGPLEDGITAKAIDGVPSFSPPPMPERGERRGGKPHRGQDRGDRGQGREDRGERGDRPARREDRGERPFGAKRERDPEAHRPAKPKRDGGEKRAEYSDKPRGDKPRGERPHGDRPHGDRPRGDRPQSDRPKGDKPRQASGAVWKQRDGDAPRKPREDGAPTRGGKSSDRPQGKGPGKGPGKPGGKSFGKPGGKPGGKFGDNTSGDKGFGKPGGKPNGKPGGKPGGKPAGKPGGKPAAKSRAADPSARFTPPGKTPRPAKPKGGKPAKAGGMQPPKRRKP